MQKILSKIKKFFRQKPIKQGIFVLLGLFIFLAAGYGVYSLICQEKFYFGVKIGDLNLGGLDRASAKNIIREKSETVADQDLILSTDDKQWVARSKDLKINYDLEKTLDSAWKVGRSKNLWTNFKTRIALIFAPEVLNCAFSYNQAAVEGLISSASAEIEIKGHDATLQIKNNEAEIIAERAGKEIDNILLEKEIISVISYLEPNREISLPLETYQPKIASSDLDGARNEVNRIIKEPIVLKWGKDDFTFAPADIGGWLEFSTFNNQKIAQKQSVFAQEQSYVFSYFFNQDKIRASIDDFGKKINRDPVDAKLTISSGKATVFQSSQDGYELDQEKTLNNIGEILGQRKKVAGLSSEGQEITASEINLAVKTKKPAISNETINDLGIKEMIAAGTTSFAGSPENRKYNIKLGAGFLNGALVKPGEVFSLMTTLGNVSESRGFRQELVIKEDRTEPEVGGGLCQVSTTMFRAALNSGMEIIERSNHKYRVSYYEPPVGMDATVYDPSPDFKFKNNTPGYILIQTKVSGNNLTFEFYGTKDGRKIEISNPTIYDQVDPPEPVYVDDPSLAAGEVKQVEKAHQGVKAYFHYKVIAADGDVLTEKTFNSTYAPWGAKYLKGPDLPPEENNQNPTNPTP